MIDADISGLNHLYLLKVRELARDDLEQAQILSGLGNEVLQQLAHHTDGAGLTDDLRRDPARLVEYLRASSRQPPSGE